MAAVEAEAADCNTRLQLAERLVNGLSAENERWGTEIDQLGERSLTIAGDTLLGAAFASYIGAFDMGFRDQLWRSEWVPDLESREVPLTPGVDPLAVLADDSRIATWMTEGLPADRVSQENGAILTSCSRWPLLIDPQLQGMKWLHE